VVRVWAKILNFKPHSVNFERVKLEISKLVLGYTLECFISWMTKIPKVQGPIFLNFGTSSIYLDQVKQDTSNSQIVAMWQEIANG